jgi:hypothetical protein
VKRVSKPEELLAWLMARETRIIPASCDNIHRHDGTVSDGESRLLYVFLLKLPSDLQFRLALPLNVRRKSIGDPASPNVIQKPLLSLYLCSA